MKKKLVLGIILLILIGGGVYYFLGNRESDAVKFSKEYTRVGEKNVFVYRNFDEIVSIMEKGTGVVYLGFPECPWCQAYVKYLNEVAQDVGIDKIYYYNILEDRKNNTKEYQKLVSLLSGALEYDEEGNERIYVPNVSFHIKGSFIGNDNETSLDTHDLNTPEEYWTEDEVKDLKATLKGYMEEVYIALNACSDCNK